MQIGCNTILFAGFDLDTAFKCIAWAGYDGAELLFDPYALLKDAIFSSLYKDPNWVGNAMVNVHSGHMINQAVLTERREQIANGVKVMAEKFGLSLFAIECISEKKSMSAAFPLAKDLNIPTIVTFSGGTSGDENSTKKAITDLRALTLEAEKWGVRLAVKPHQNCAIYNTATVLRLIKEVDSPALGIDFDTRQFYAGGDDLFESIEKSGKHIIHCHLRDCESRKSRGLPEAQVAGHGEINIPNVLKSIKEIGYKGYLSFECVGAGTYELPRVMALAAEHRGYVYRCLQELGLR